MDLLTIRRRSLLAAIFVIAMAQYSCLCAPIAAQDAAPASPQATPPQAPTAPAEPSQQGGAPSPAASNQAAPPTEAQAASAPSSEASSAQALANQLANPVANLISFPLQNNFDADIGPASGTRYTLNIQPVIPVSLNDQWLVITRTIMPVVSQSNVLGDSGRQFGLGSITQSDFFSPKAKSPSGLIWGAGPVFVIPTATDHRLGSTDWGIGPTALILLQKGPSTIGILTNQIWAGSLSQLFLQPFFSVADKQGFTKGISSETNYNWNTHQWVVPILFNVSQITKFGNQPVSLGASLKVGLSSPEGAPHWGLRFVLTYLFPKG